MGYTHYFEKKNGLKNSKFLDFIGDLRKVLKDTEGVLQFEYDEAKPIQVSVKGVRFNGIGDDGHETFLLTPTASDFDFCKTACKPYDKYVVASLALAKYHFGEDIQVSSDGEAEDWEEGLALLKEVLPDCNIVNPIS